VTRFRVGTSGWHYNHWRGSFYPETLPADEWFAYYARQFDTVELNNSFYRLPKAGAWKLWQDEAPEGFAFAVKASRYITHTKRLTGGASPNERLLSGARRLREHLGPVLYQLPRRFKCNDETVERLAAFVELLPPDLSHVFEFRDASWFTEPVFSLLEHAGAHFCAFDMPGIECPLRVTAGLLYFRFHGTGQRYGGNYPDSALGDWAARLKRASSGTTEAFVYFNNDIGGFAPRNAATLAQLLSARDGTDS
jgi:uncharacterized protein YecE (DUF72 family)